MSSPTTSTEKPKDVDKPPKKHTLSQNILSQIFFQSAGALILAGFRSPLQHSQLWDLPPTYSSDAIWEEFEPHWNAELKRSEATNKPASLRRAVVKTFWKQYAVGLLFQFIFGCASFVNPVVLPYMLTYVVDHTVATYWGFVYIAIIMVVTVLGSFFYYRAMFIGATTGIKIRILLTQIVYKKVLKIAPNKSNSAGQVVNLIANDTQFFADTLQNFSAGLVAPMQIVVAVGLLSRQIQAFSLLSIGVFLLVVPVSGKIGRIVGGYRSKIQAQADRRLKLSNELLSAIRIVKFYAWENAFVQNISRARERELKEVGMLGYWRSTLITLMYQTTTLIIASIFVLYGFFGSETMTVEKAFSTLSLINLLRFPFFLLPITITFFQQYNTTFQRVQDFILRPDLEQQTSSVERIGSADVSIQDGEFKWDPKAEKPTLSNINFKVSNGQLVMIAGRVGSGKSSLAMAVLGEIPQTGGKRSLQGSVAYVPQEAWIMNATLKDNILFGEPFDADKYQRVIHASALGPDLAQLPYGDSTEIGERGITLSGGQKQRVSIARALYSDRDLYILDDPFSAVDSHVGLHLFENALRGYLRNKTIIFITNQLQYLPYADTLYTLKDGTFENKGNFKDLMENSQSFQEMMKAFGKVESKKPDEPKKPDTPKTEVKPPSEVTKQVSSSPLAKAAENKASGLVSWRIYAYYIKAGGVSIFMIILFCFFASAALNILAAWWLTVWTSARDANRVSYYVGIYCAWLAGQACVVSVTYFLFVYFCKSASRFLHQSMLLKVVRAPASFFDVTPLGRIINRFAKELSNVDALLPIQLSQYMFSVFNLIAVFAGMMFGSVWVIFAIVPCIIFYGWFQWFYRHTSVELQRMEALARAPILSHLGETMNGVSCIRAYGAQERFRVINKTRVDFHATELYTLRYCSSFFGLRLDFTGEFLVFVTLLAIVLTRIINPSSSDVGFAGLAMTYTAGITFLLSNLNSMAVETETRMNSVERIKEYDTLPQEAADVIPDNRPPADWPQEGVVKFQNYSLAYRKGELVLKNIDATVRSHAKVGIVGRTGAGKSSLMQALFRMVEPAEGTILIDGVDITKIGLQDLRSKLSIIPQDPSLFIGTVRYNLDPFESHDDNDLWSALEMVQLKDVVSAMPNKLDELITENGGNLSVGQRQLVCMARALLRRSKILLMDEATASVDLTTDTLIQKMVRKNFKDVTVLTIAHRLNTIMDSTKVMVLDRGELKEYDKPIKLLQLEGGIFNGMVNATGPSVSQYLRQIAKGEINVLESIDLQKKVEGKDDIEELVLTEPAKKEKKSKKKSKKQKKEKHNTDEN